MPTTITHRAALSAKSIPSEIFPLQTPITTAPFPDSIVFLNIGSQSICLLFKLF